MSLMLRKQCQEILDNHGLNNFHVEISHSKHMAIVSECGKPLVHIQGITFSRTNPTKDEIEYAVELLGPFLIKYKNEIQEYLKELAVLAGMKEQNQNGDNYHIAVYGDGANINYRDDIWSITLHSNGDIKEIGSTKIIKEDEIDGNFSMDMKLYDEMRTTLSKFLAYRAQEDKVDNVSRKLSVCTI